MRPLTILDEQRFVIETSSTISGTIITVRYPPLGLVRTGRPKQQRSLMHRLRAEVARALLTTPGLIGEPRRWARPVDSRQVDFIARSPDLSCDEIERMLGQESGEMLYMAVALAMMRECEVWTHLSARPEVLANAGLRALLSDTDVAGHSNR